MAPLPYLQVLRGPLELLRLLLVQPVLKEASVVVHGLLVELGQHAGAPLLRTTSVVHLLLGSYVVLPDLPFLGGGEGRSGGEMWMGRARVQVGTRGWRERGEGR